jgi:hypothetical protein
MKKFLYAIAFFLLVSCAGKDADVRVITDFYDAVLGKTVMTDELLQQSLSQEVLSDLWEADYENTYSWWAFRTGYQDGPSDVSSLDGIESLGQGWYRVSYTDMGIEATTDVKLKDGKITEYRPFRAPDSAE